MPKDLTAYGEEQCRQLAQSFPNHGSVDLLVCSPLRRTIYTTLLGFKPDIERGVKVIALPEAQETAAVPCDTGTEVWALKKEMEGKPVDLSRLTEGWHIKSGRWAPTAEAIEKRSREARQWLRARPEKEIILVTHGGFLHYFTEDWTGYKQALGNTLRRCFSRCGADSTPGTGWANVEYRTYQFTNEESDDASLAETAHSKEARRGTEKPLTKTEQMELKETAQKTWEAGKVHPLQAKA
ncbi:MAG: hypothetical protein Q9164_002075 [Protoblastenia rupestris]